MRFKKVSLFIIVFSFLSFLSGGTWTYLLSKDRTQDVVRSLEKFAKVYDIVKRNYVTEPTDPELVDGAIAGMLAELDPHSVYLKKEDFQEMQSDTRGEFGGLGIEIAKRDGMLTVVSPIEDTPAFRAGVKAGDVIVKIENEVTANLSVIDAVKLMRGKPGEPINITVKREGADALIPFKITRAIIQVQSVKWEVKDGFGVVKVRQFLERSSTEVRKAIGKITEENGSIKGLVLDLRNNPGGLLSQAIEISDIFLSEGLVVSTRGRDEDKVSKSYAVAKGTEPNYPLVVLVNGGSASASEIVSGALQDHKRAHLLGTQTFGKGSVQNVIPLDDGSGVKLTVAKYYTPLGREIQGAGIVPDEVVRGINDPVDIIRERDLPGHLVGSEEEKAKQREKLAKEEAEKRKQAKAPAGNALSPDKEPDLQLEAAIAYLKKASSSANLGVVK